MRAALPALIAIAVLSVAPSLRADDDDPEYNGKTMSEWTTMARESQTLRLRRLAASALGQIGSDALPKIRRKVCETLGSVFRRDSAGAVRAEAAKSLGVISTELLKDMLGDTGSVVIDLAEGLRVEKDVDAKREAAAALGRYGPSAKGAAAVLTGMLGDADAGVKEQVAMTLGRIGGESKAALDPLLPLLKDKEPGVRRAAVFALGRIEAEDRAKAAAAVVALLATEKTPELRLEIVTSLSLLKDKNVDVIKGLAGTLKDENVDIRRQAAKGLGGFDDAAKGAEKELAEAFKGDADKFVRVYALHSLCIASSEVDKIISTLIERLDPKIEKEIEVRIAICDEIGALGPAADAAIPKLREAQKDPEIRVRDAAAAAIKKLIAKPTPPKP